MLELHLISRKRRRRRQRRRAFDSSPPISARDPPRDSCIKRNLQRWRASDSSPPSSARGYPRAPPLSHPGSDGRRPPGSHRRQKIFFPFLLSTAPYNLYWYLVLYFAGSFDLDRLPHIQSSELRSSVEQAVAIFYLLGIEVQNKLRSSPWCSYACRERCVAGFTVVVLCKYFLLFRNFRLLKLKLLNLLMWLLKISVTILFRGISRRIVSLSW
jgi:hypothetical protein